MVHSPYGTYGTVHMKRYVKRQYILYMVESTYVKHCADQAFIQQSVKLSNAHKHNYVCGGVVS